MAEFAAVDRRKRSLQVVLFLIILATLPFYCVGFILLGTAETARPTPTLRATTPAALTRTINTPTRIAFPSITPIGGNGGNPLLPTPSQFIPPVFPTVNLPPTVIFPTATNYVFPTQTTAPSLTPIPTDTQSLPPTQAATATSLPFPSDTPFVPDTDGDGIPDNVDLCPSVPGLPPDGCPPPPGTPSDTPIPPGP
jgi:hypothetical protein